MEILDIASLSMQVNRKSIKNLHISVLPPDGRVRVSAPKTMTETALRMAVISRIPWIKKQQADFARQPRQSDREMVNGECHYLWGRRYRLNIIETNGHHQAKVMRGKIDLHVRKGTSKSNKTLVLSNYYRELLKRAVDPLIQHWQDKMGVFTTYWGVKKMKTKWGSCNTDTKRIWLNLELAKKPPECLEYILVHELVHLLERKHNERFKAYMDEFLPDWRERRDLLNKTPLVFEHWGY